MGGAGFLLRTRTCVAALVHMPTSLLSSPPPSQSLSLSLSLLLLGQIGDADGKCVVNATTFIAHEGGPTNNTTMQSKAEPSSLSLSSASPDLACMYNVHVSIRRMVDIETKFFLSIF